MEQRHAQRRRRGVDGGIIGGGIRRVDGGVAFVDRGGDVGGDVVHDAGQVCKWGFEGWLLMALGEVYIYYLLYIVDSRVQSNFTPNCTTIHPKIHTRRELALARHLVQHAADGVLKLRGQQRQPATVRHPDDGGLRACLFGGDGGCWCVDYGYR